MMRRSMKKILYIIVLALVGLASCRQPAVPKPYGYFRIAIPDTSYAWYHEADYPYTFLLSNNAVVVPRTQAGEQYWIDIVYPTLNTRVHCSYKPIRNNLRVLSRDAQEFLMSHASIASAIPGQDFSNPEESVYGVYYELHGNTASSVQFVLTDSVEHFIRGSVYCNAVPNQDSLAPIYDYKREDVRRLMESMRWKK